MPSIGSNSNKLEDSFNSIFLFYRILLIMYITYTLHNIYNSLLSAKIKKCLANRT